MPEHLIELQGKYFEATQESKTAFELYDAKRRELFAKYGDRAATSPTPAETTERQTLYDEYYQKRRLAKGAARAFYDELERVYPGTL